MRNGFVYLRLGAADVLIEGIVCVVGHSYEKKEKKNVSIIVDIYNGVDNGGGYGAR